jgi:hypothetical protein
MMECMCSIVHAFSCMTKHQIPSQFSVFFYSVHTVYSSSRPPLAFACFRGWSYNSSQQDQLDGPSLWAPWAPENVQPCKTSLFCFRFQPHHSSQHDQLDGPRPWAPWTPETFEKPVKPLSFVSEASHIIPASRIGWMGGAREHSGPQKHSKSLSNFSILFQIPATSFQPA